MRTSAILLSVQLLPRRRPRRQPPRRWLRSDGTADIMLGTAAALSTRMHEPGSTLPLLTKQAWSTGPRKEGPSDCNSV